MNNPAVTPGKFLSFEGGEGAGKSTQIKALASALRAKGISVVCTREPGGTTGAEQVRRILKEGDKDTWDGMSEALLFYAARRDVSEKVIKPALAAGTWVLADRFADSSLIYQGAARGLGAETILKLHDIVLGDFWPDMTFLLDVCPEAGLMRVDDRAQALVEAEHEKDRFEQMDISFHETIHKAYLARAAASDRYVVIDALGTPQEVHAAIMASLSDTIVKP